MCRVDPSLSSCCKDRNIFSYLQLLLDKLVDKQVINKQRFISGAWYVKPLLMLYSSSHLMAILSSLLTPLSSPCVQDFLTNWNNGQSVFKINVYTSFIYKYDNKSVIHVLFFISMPFFLPMLFFEERRAYCYAASAVCQSIGPSSFSFHFLRKGCTYWNDI